jgi:aldehyde:ferredoxin oxidoreductase
MLNDSLPLCDFAFPQLVRPLKNRVEWEASGDISGDVNIGCRIFYAVTGIEISNKELLNNVVRAFTLERALLARAGRSRAMEETLAPHFKLPCKQDGTLVELDQFYQLMDEYYSARGWDLELGWPKKETLKELGLEDIIDELDTLRQSIKPVIKEN